MSQIYLEKCNLCLIPLIALKRNILENSNFVLLKEDIHRFISSIELFLRDIRGLRYADLKKVNFFAGHPVSSFLIQNKLSNEWSTIFVVYIFPWELEKNWHKNWNERNQCIFRTRNMHENRNSRPDILQAPISKFTSSRYQY